MGQSSTFAPHAWLDHSLAPGLTLAHADNRARPGGRRNSRSGDDCDDLDDSLLNYLLDGRDPVSTGILLRYMHTALYCCTHLLVNRHSAATQRHKVERARMAYTA